MWQELQLITSRQNSLIKETVALLQEGKAKREQLILIEGLRHNSTALEAYSYHYVFFSDDPEGQACFEELSKQLALNPERLRRLAPHIFSQIAATQHSQGVISVVEAPDLPDLSQTTAPLSGNFIVLEQCRDPGNLGTILRTADALGLAGLILLGDSVWPYNGKSLRASMGSALYLPVWQAEDVQQLKAKLPDHDLLAADMAGTSLASYQPLTPGGDFALLLGNEAHGLSPEAKATADLVISVEMGGRAESLNLASATAIMAWQLQRLYSGKFA